MKIVSNKPTITRKELESVLDSLINDELVAGESVRTLETSIAKMLGIKYPLATCSLTAAYHLIFKALEIGGDDEVIIPSFFPKAPVSALSVTGGKPVLVDSEKDSLFPSADAIRAKITEKTRAILVSHLFGYHFYCNEFGDITVPVIEDISHAIGTEVDENPCGRFGAITVLSFDPAGILTTGNGGMVLTNNSKYYSVMKELRGNGNDHIHYEYTMTDFQGAMGISQLGKLPDLLIRRREIAKMYHDALKITPHKAPYLYNDRFAYQSFPVLFNVPNEKIESYWRKNRVEAARSLPYPLHTLLGLNPADFPNSDRISKKLFSIPLYPTLSRRDVEKISKLLASFI